MEYIIVFVSTYIIVTIFYYIIMMKFNKKRKIKDIKEILILIKRYDLDIKKINKIKILRQIILINSFIISLVSIILMYLPMENPIYTLLGFTGGFILLFLLIYSCYEIYGKYLNSKIGVNKNE